MRYENRCTNLTTRTGPDFRESDGAEFPAPSMMAWLSRCTGIMLSRVLSSQLLGDPQHKLDLERGMRAAVRWLSDPDVAVESATLFAMVSLERGGILHAAAMPGDDSAAPLLSARPRAG